MRFGVGGPNVPRMVSQTRLRWRRDTERAARIATDRAARETQQHVKRRMRSVGLGRLGGAVGQTSALRKKQDDRFYGVIYAKGKSKPDDRGAGALEAYSEGVTIRARNTTWLAFQTTAVPRRAGRKRMTPFRYQTMGYQAALGPLEFRPINSKMALLVIKKVSLHPKTGRAKRAGPGRSRTRVDKKEAVAFILIKVTRRAQRFDEKLIAQVYAKRVPEYMLAALKDIQRGRTPAATFVGSSTMRMAA